MRPKNTPNCICEYCGSPYYEKPSRLSRSRFCSVKCRGYGRYGRTAQGDALVGLGNGTIGVPLSRGHMAIIDSSDSGIVSRYHWTSFRVGRRVYAVSRDGGGSLLMHRVVMDAPDGMDVDHIDGDGLNNVRENLRIASRSENMANVPARSNNSSGYKGVSWHQGAKKWRATINQGGQRHLGFFDTPEEAAHAYDLAAVELQCEFAHLNFPT